LGLRITTLLNTDIVDNSARRFKCLRPEACTSAKL